MSCKRPEHGSHGARVGVFMLNVVLSKVVDVFRMGKHKGEVRLCPGVPAADANIVPYQG